VDATKRDHRVKLNVHYDAHMMHNQQFAISLAQWSLHRTIESGELDPLDFPQYSLQRFGIDAVEYVNGCFGHRAELPPTWEQLRSRCDDLGVRSLLIMIDRCGDLGHTDNARRISAVENHYVWVERAALLGCHSIRVNAKSTGTPDQQRERAIDGLSRLSEFAAAHDINVLVENHGGLSSDGAWLTSVIAGVGRDNCGTLPDFGNFFIGTDWLDEAQQRDPACWYDRYRGVAEMMPFARAVSAKSNDFDDHGNETRTDYERMMRIVLDAGYHGHVGIEYEGDTLPEAEGIAATQRLLERVRAETADTRPQPV
jgi:sugar phosphate isomerase/epimerase